MLKSDLQSDLAGNWQLVQAEGQEDVDESEEKAMDTESTSVLWSQSSCVFFVLLPFWQKIADSCRTRRITYVMLCTQQGKRSKGHRLTERPNVVQHLNQDCLRYREGCREGQK